MCMNCGACSKEHAPSTDDSIDKVEDLGFCHKNFIKWL